MKITSVKYKKDYVLSVEFYNGEKKEIDLENFMRTHRHDSVKKYLDKKLFKQVKIHGGLSWNNEMDLSGDFIYRMKPYRSN